MAAPAVPWLEIVAPEAFVMLPPVNSPMASSNVPVMVPEFETVPAPPLILMASSPPVIELVLVTEPPPPSATPYPPPEIEALFVTLPVPPVM